MSPTAISLQDKASGSTCVWLNIAKFIFFMRFHFPIHSYSEFSDALLLYRCAVSLLSLRMFTHYAIFATWFCKCMQKAFDTPNKKLCIFPKQKKITQKCQTLFSHFHFMQGLYYFSSIQIHKNRITTHYFPLHL